MSLVKIPVTFCVESRRPSPDSAIHWEASQDAKNRHITTHRFITAKGCKAKGR